MSTYMHVVAYVHKSGTVRVLYTYAAAKSLLLIAQTIPALLSYRLLYGYPFRRTSLAYILMAPAGLTVLMIDSLIMLNVTQSGISTEKRVHTTLLHLSSSAGSNDNRLLG